MPESREKARARSKTFRDRKRAKGICTWCGKKPIHRTSIAKCFDCLRRNAWFQSEYRDRLKRRAISWRMNHTTT